MFIVITILAIFFALNMGGASFAASFAASYGGRVVNRLQAGLLFVIFVVLGAVLFGEQVSVTLGKNLIHADLLSSKAIAIILFAAGISMFQANVINIPQSTSLVTVAAIAGVGFYLNELDLNVLFYLIPFWIILPILSYVITRYAAGYVYPPRRANFWIYQKLVNHQSRLKKFVLIASCYNAFSVGTNNVANVVGPVMGISTWAMIQLLSIFAFIYGVGAFAFTGPLKTAGDKIVPLGLLTAAIVSFVSGTLMIFASSYGVPQSFVMLQMGALFAVSSLKKGTEFTFKNPIAVKTFYTWTINPVLTFVLSYGLAFVFLR